MWKEVGEPCIDVVNSTEDGIIQAVKTSYVEWDGPKEEIANLIADKANNCNYVINSSMEVTRGDVSGKSIATKLVCLAFVGLGIAIGVKKLNESTQKTTKNNEDIKVVEGEIVDIKTN